MLRQNPEKCTYSMNPLINSLKSTNKFTTMEGRSVVDKLTNQYKETFGVMSFVHYYDCGNSSISICIYDKL